MAYHWQDKFLAEGGRPNPRLGTRFDALGRFLPEPGNTVVARVVAGSATDTALADLRARLRALPYGHCFAFTDPASYHMTVFEGVTQTRRVAGFWPQSLPLDLPIDAMTRAMADRLADFPPLPGFAMCVAEVTPHGLHLTGATPEDDRTVRDWRDALAQAFGFRAPGHGDYRFHLTLAYHILWPPAEAVPVYQAELDRLTAEFAARVPVLHLARPAFCSFADMNAFPPVVPL